MKAYFTTSISNLDKDLRESSKKICLHLSSVGHTVIPDKVYEKSQKQIQQQTSKEAKEAQHQLQRFRIAADFAVIEASKPTVAVGQEMNDLLSMNKPVIALHMSKYSKPHLLTSTKSDYLVVCEYDEFNIEQALDNALDYISSKTDVRFNMMLSPEMYQYLDTVSKRERVPKSVFIRRLIKEHQERDSKYNENEN